ncbi:hypothetical protein D3C71_1114410 [compost metagenome]
MQARGRLHGVPEARFGHLLEALLVQAQRHGWLGREVGGDLQRACTHLIGRDQVMDQAKLVAFARVHHAAAQRELDGARQAEHLAHDPRPRHAGDAGVDLGLPHLHAVVGHADVTQQAHLES